jgi:glycosyltransferase involved in cell wall biosynthesis
VTEKIFIFTSEPFPHGMAATNRILAHARGFLEHDKQVEVVVFRKTEPPDKVNNAIILGEYRKVSFRYLSSSTIKSKFFFARRIEELIIYFRLLVFAFRHLSKNAISYYYSADTVPALLLRLGCWYRNSPLIKEENEHPKVYIREKDLMSAFLFRIIHYSIFDGLILMTNQLVEYFRDEMKYFKPVILIPMSVDVTRFESHNAVSEKWITYCGVLNDEKDGTSLLIKAFFKLNKNYPQHKLLLIGPPVDERTGKMYLRLVQQMKLEQDVVFFGPAGNEQIPELLMKSALLVLPRPDSLQATYGFPTKLGEYLATGKPVIASKVGEIGEYLMDGINAFLAKPGNSDSLAAKMEEALSNEKASAEIGRKGRKLVLDKFHHISLAGRIIHFFDQLLS